MSIFVIEDLCSLLLNPRDARYDFDNGSLASGSLASGSLGLSCQNHIWHHWDSRDTANIIFLDASLRWHDIWLICHPERNGGSLRYFYVMCK